MLPQLSQANKQNAVRDNLNIENPTVIPTGLLVSMKVRLGFFVSLLSRPKQDTTRGNAVKIRG